jgi:hypothetical protein
MDKLMDRQALLQDKIDALGAWEIDNFKLRNRQYVP